MKKIFTLLVLTTLFGCGASSDYSQSAINRNFYSNKAIHFQLSSESQNWLVRKGPNQTVGGAFVEPNVSQEFENAIKELGSETGLNLSVIDSASAVTNSNSIIVKVKVTKLLWKFGFSSATMYCDANFLADENKTYQITGSHKTGGAGRASTNVKNGFKNLTYNFLKEFEK